MPSFQERVLRPQSIFKQLEALIDDYQWGAFESQPIPGKEAEGRLFVRSGIPTENPDAIRRTLALARLLKEALSPQIEAIARDRSARNLPEETFTFGSAEHSGMACVGLIQHPDFAFNAKAAREEIPRLANLLMEWHLPFAKSMKAKDPKSYYVGPFSKYNALKTERLVGILSEYYGLPTPTLSVFPNEEEMIYLACNRTVMEQLMRRESVLRPPRDSPGR